MQQLFIQAIEKAKQSIVLVIYTLSDEKIIEALNKQVRLGVSVLVVHDSSTLKNSPKTLLFNTTPIEVAGLMHQKILIVDEKYLWMGSANFTRASLKLDDNLVIGLSSRELAKGILEKKSYLEATCGKQRMEFWSFPMEGKRGLKRLISLIDQAKESVFVAMFTWTHPKITEAIIRAHKRGVAVKVVIDQRSGYGVSSKAGQQLKLEGVSIRLSSGLSLLHHKFVWIDHTTLVNGSANWTRAAFSRNWDYFLILHDLTKIQKAKMERLWRVIELSNKKHLSVLRKRPVLVRDHLFESIYMAA